jgi:hypothetical protein
MKHITPFLVLIMVSITTLSAQNNLPQKSPKASVSYHVGLTDISIQYAAPAVRNRSIWGGVVPYGKIWRAGANNATVVSFSTPVKVEGKTLAAGAYAFFLIPNETQRWTAVFNTNPNQWGAYIYSEAKDAARVGAKVEKLEQTAERLVYQIVDLSLEEGQISLLWGDKKVSVKFRVDVVTPALAKYDSLIASAEPKQKWYFRAEAADLLTEAGKLNEAQKYLEESLQQGEHVWNLWKKALWQAKRQDHIGAFASTEKIRNLVKTTSDKEEKGVFGALETDIVATEKHWRAQQAEAQAARSALRDINRDIWTPFSEAYASNDAAKYLALHSKEFIRANGNSKSSQDLAGYSASVERSFAWTAEDGGRSTIEFRFFERIATASTASERGIYKYTYHPKNGSPNEGYGQFHVVLRKENGVWKILTDYDSNEGGKIGAAEYQAALAVDDFSKF